MYQKTFLFLRFFNLRKSVVTVYNNGRLHSRTETGLEDETYQITKDKKTILPPADNIGFTGYDLYFTPPKQVQKLYSLSNGEMELVKQIDSSSFEIIDSKGRKNTYRYNQEGLADYIKIPHKVYDIEFKLIKSQ